MINGVDARHEVAEKGEPDRAGEFVDFEAQPPSGRAEQRDAVKGDHNAKVAIRNPASQRLQVRAQRLDRMPGVVAVLAPHCDQAAVVDVQLHDPVASVHPRPVSEGCLRSPIALHSEEEKTARAHGLHSVKALHQTLPRCPDGDHANRTAAPGTAQPQDRPG